MMSEEELVNSAFEILGSLLVNSEDAKEEAIKSMIDHYDLEVSIAEEIVSIAFERWMEIYDPE